eukprot:NODE_4094_length_843_cov_5.264484_g3388_i0.p1 GENE.NODE_4094_length_843_cov_5.264484_g3388_i0~~NODE_4094_length_843_cov_5.264484_g3388_i0.p1  ORF type:complete len:254 (-),score=57.74 NODE_4094_length_843_cov_5.264484_g3388_i0:80-808(-)
MEADIQAKNAAFQKQKQARQAAKQAKLKEAEGAREAKLKEAKLAREDKLAEARLAKEARQVEAQHAKEARQAEAKLAKEARQAEAKETRQAEAKLAKEAKQAEAKLEEVKQEEAKQEPPPVEVSVAKCKAGHPLQPMLAGPSIVCDGCHRRLFGEQAYGCRPHDYDLCQSCASKEVKPQTTVPVTSSPEHQGHPKPSPECGPGWWGPHGHWMRGRARACPSKPAISLSTAEDGVITIKIRPN